jgi:hypothetical protein
MTELFPRPVDRSTPFELQSLQALPCGCVAGGFRARSLSVDLVSLEAKGPHCPFDDHAAGGVLELGESVDVVVDVERAAS